MNSIVLYCKSFNRDVWRCKILLESILKHNKENIPFYISVPFEDVQLFKTTLGTDGYTLISDEEIMGNKLAESWKNQQIVKMLFWKTKIAENFLILDSDSYFIKDFSISDFIHPSGNPYTVMHQQHELFSWTSKNKDILGFDPSISFGECRTPIQELLDRKGKLYDFGPVPCVWSSKVWETLEEKYIKPNNLTFENLINTIPSEFSWYGETLLTWKPIELWPIEPLFKVFHFLPQYHEAKNMGYTEQHWSQNFLGIVCQSSSGLPLTY